MGSFDRVLVTDVLYRMDAEEDSNRLSGWESIYVNLGHVYRKQQRWQEAEEVYFKALSLKPGQASTYAALAFTYHLQVSFTRFARLVFTLTPSSAMSYPNQESKALMAVQSCMLQVLGGKDMHSLHALTRKKRRLDRCQNSLNGLYVAGAIAAGNAVLSQVLGCETRRHLCE